MKGDRTCQDTAMQVAQLHYRWVMKEAIPVLAVKLGATWNSQAVWENLQPRIATQVELTDVLLSIAAANKPEDVPIVAALMRGNCEDLCRMAAKTLWVMPNAAARKAITKGGRLFSGVRKEGRKFIKELLQTSPADVSGLRALLQEEWVEAPERPEAGHLKEFREELQGCVALLRCDSRLLGEGRRHILRACLEAALLGKIYATRQSFNFAWCAEGVEVGAEFLQLANLLKEPLEQRRYFQLELLRAAAGHIVTPLLPVVLSEARKRVLRLSGKGSPANLMGMLLQSSYNGASHLFLRCLSGSLAAEILLEILPGAIAGPSDLLSETEMAYRRVGGCFTGSLADSYAQESDMFCVLRRDGTTPSSREGLHAQLLRWGWGSRTPYGWVGAVVGGLSHGEYSYAEASLGRAVNIAMQDGVPAVSKAEAAFWKEFVQYCQYDPLEGRPKAESWEQDFVTCLESLRSTLDDHFAGQQQPVES